MKHPRSGRSAVDVPLVVVSLGVVAAAVVALLTSFRLGAAVLAALLVVVAIVRALPTPWAAAFVNRSMAVDIVTLLVLAGGIGFLAYSVPGN
ncbi:DUF3017 domain-containing protein [Saxibacter everestensis]|uniref:DUF3017 domain-containing protein n=1 Tax=Saxibacter everestensis TaxID=2909229 RepID=A0ABY8QP85_9MICO|nr:DUF3017 domain-containing protein [Brevibacteriaceae bacterium ZFBP1038]